MAGESEEFKGEYRKGPKTHLVRTASGSLAPAKSYKGIKALLDALPTHQVMKQKYPKLFLKKGATNTRVAEEKQNVRVVGWMFDAKREDDEDYHVIVGTQSSGTDNTFMNVEVSGLPPSGKDRTDLKAARIEFENIAQRTISRAHYNNFIPPIKVRITGSLFFDGDHAPGSIGPMGHKPKTVWEIHPVAKIEAI
jgi:hypothetical protein